MATKPSPLLCELHAHTTWSDGSLSVRELCDLYDLLVIPGPELTMDDPDPLQSAHAVAMGVRSYVEVSTDLELALPAARAQGAALVAAHPYSPETLPAATRATGAFGARPELHRLVDRFELFNRYTLFGWVAAAGLPAVGTGDFHRLEHLPGWKTLLPCQRASRR